MTWKTRLPGGVFAASGYNTAKVVLADPAVDSLSSFIGVDGSNATLNAGRMLINLKPLEERRISASEVIRRLQPRLAEVPGHDFIVSHVQTLAPAWVAT